MNAEAVETDVLVLLVVSVALAPAFGVSHEMHLVDSDLFCTKHSEHSQLLEGGANLSPQELVTTGSVVDVCLSFGVEVFALLESVEPNLKSEEDDFVSSGLLSKALNELVEAADEVNLFAKISFGLMVKSVVADFTGDKEVLLLIKLAEIFSFAPMVPENNEVEPMLLVALVAFDSFAADSVGAKEIGGLSRLVLTFPKSNPV